MQVCSILLILCNLEILVKSRENESPARRGSKALKCSEKFDYAIENSDSNFLGEICKIDVDIEAV